MFILEFISLAKFIPDLVYNLCSAELWPTSKTKTALIHSFIHSFSASGLAQSCEQLKRHTASVEGALARREGTAMEQSAHAQGELAQKDREMTELRNTMEALRNSVETEQNAVREAKKQVPTRVAI